MPAPAPVSSSPRASIHAQPHEQSKQHVQKQAVSRKPLKADRKPPKVDKHALSARSGNLLSDAAIAAQARASEGTVSQHVKNAVKAWPGVASEPSAKRPRLEPAAALPARISADLTPGSSTDAWRFKTKADAMRFLEEIDVMLCEEENGDIVGYDASDKRHGGEGDPPLPPHAVEAFYVLNDGPEAVYVEGVGQWQIVGKGGAKAK